ncbi:MFS transporter [Aeromicrobium sp. 9AM]|uniref:MFS transporter n=1 Tax=Aeromicrobium sp. 9AM TaxID=2653126 RepID=UPI0012F221D7|nr:MFS transporter [Aeromicrobium sp. 9AM]VXB07466.1 Major Facilitator Superfamily protein [Aeromicrobium sp. 9AM]
MNVRPEARVQRGLSKEHRRVAAASLIGSVIEWYDFYLYGTAAALVFGSEFFPGLSPTAGVLASFATFAVGFGARPVGGLIFGHFGDRIGRKTTLVASLLTMGIASVAIGVLPTYSTIGVWAPALLVLLRLIQGIGLGGETSGAVLISLEHAPAGKRNLYGGFPQMGVPAGLVLANIVFLVITHAVSEEALTTWAWRVPFLFSAVLVAVGILIRVGISETPEFLEVKQRNDVLAAPGVAAVRSNWRQILLTVLLIIGAAGCSYVFTVFTLSYGPTTLGFERQSLLLGVAGASLVWMLTIPFWTSVADRVGRRKVFLSGSVSLVIVAASYFALLDTRNAVAIGIGFAAMGFVLPMTHGLQGSIMADVFPAGMRYSGMGWILGLASVIGGLSPFIAQWLFGLTDDASLITAYMILMSAASLGSALVLFKITPEVEIGRAAEPAEVAPNFI